MKHEVLLPHELVGSFYKRSDLFRLLTGDPGETLLHELGGLTDTIIFQPRLLGITGKLKCR